MLLNEPDEWSYNEFDLNMEVPVAIPDGASLAPEPDLHADVQFSAQERARLDRMMSGMQGLRVSREGALRAARAEAEAEAEAQSKVAADGSTRPQLRVTALRDATPPEQSVSPTARSLQQVHGFFKDGVITEEQRGALKDAVLQGSADGVDSLRGSDTFDQLLTSILSPRFLDSSAKKKK